MQDFYPKIASPGSTLYIKGSNFYQNIIPNIYVGGVKQLYYLRTSPEMILVHLDNANAGDVSVLNQFGVGNFKPTCKHLQWAHANTRLQALRYQVKDATGEYNPRICVYTFDHRRSLLLYRVTYDGVKANGQWLPVEGWKEKPIYGLGGIPTGECWDTFFAALSKEEPFKLVPFSSAVSTLMNSTRSKN